MKKRAKKPFSFLKYVKKYIPLVILNIILNIGIYVMVFYSSIFAARGLEAVTLSDLHLAIKYLGISSGMYVAINILNYPLDMIYCYVTSHIYVDIKRDLTARLFEISAESYGESGASAFVQRVLNDSEQVFRVFTSIFEIVCDLVTNVVILVYIMTFNVYIGLFILGTLVIVVLFDYFRNRWIKKNRKEIRNIDDKVYSYTNEIVRSQLDIKTLDLEESLKSTTQDMHKGLEGKKLKFNYKAGGLRTLKNVFSNSVAFCIVILAVFIFEKFAMPMVAFLYIFQNRNVFLRMSNNLNNILSMAVDFRVSYDRIIELFEEDKFPTEKFGNEVIEECIGEVEFKDVYFSYKITEKDKENDKNKKKRRKNQEEKEEKPEIKKKQVLKGINFKVEAGDNIAIVGRSGAGKSTIVSLIPKLYECEEGEVLIDGKDIKTLSKQSLRKNISLVNQSPYIFNLSIRENLLLAKKDATEEELVNALQKASLYDFVQGLEQGLDSIVGENGVKLSGGQKQRLAIARALLKDSKIIIFDESTSSLDNFAQEEVKEAIQNLSGNRTVITVAHRLSTIKNAQKIYFIDDGKIIDSGDFDELLNGCEEFAKLFSVENI